MNMNQRREIACYLEDRLAHLKHQAAHGIEQGDACADDNEFASRISEMRMNLALQGRINQQIKDIEGTLRRLDVADYGTCEECGDDIPLARLKAKPTTRLCVHCQHEVESAPAFEAGYAPAFIPARV